MGEFTLTEEARQRLLFNTIHEEFMIFTRRAYDEKCRSKEFIYYMKASFFAAFTVCLNMLDINSKELSDDDFKKKMRALHTEISNFFHNIAQQMEDPLSSPQNIEEMVQQISLADQWSGVIEKFKKN